MKMEDGERKERRVKIDIHRQPNIQHIRYTPDAIMLLNWSSRGPEDPE